MRYSNLLVTASVAVTQAWAQGDPDCPDGLSLVEVQPEVVIRELPVDLRTSISSNTVLTFGDKTIAVNNAPTSLSSRFTLAETNTFFSTGHVAP